MLTVFIFACSLYANLALAVTDPADDRFFPPFRPYVNANGERLHHFFTPRSRFLQTAG